jgi:hypothetical protein
MELKDQNGFSKERIDEEFRKALVTCNKCKSERGFHHLVNKDYELISVCNNILCENETVLRASDEFYKKEDNQIDHPKHYGGENNPYEAIKVIEAWKLDFCLGNTIKYISRFGKKDNESELKDLRKALWYLERKIKSLEQK